MRAYQVNKLVDSDLGGDFRVSGEVERAWGTGTRSFQDMEVDHGGFHARMFVKDGRSRILGWGVITSACDHGTEDTFRWTVKWMSKEIRDIHPKYLPNPPLT